MKKTGLTMALSILLSVLIAVPAYANPSKDESVYAALGYDGTVQGIEVVNRFTGIDAGKPITDYGTYDEVTNLTNGIQPTVSGDSVTWELGGDPPEEFYYQGAADQPLPYTVSIRYTLDGETVTGDTLAGKSGRLAIGIDIAPNTACPESVRENLMVQASMSLDSAKCLNVRADGATLVVMGGLINLNYTVLPGEDAAYTLEMDVTDFSMDGITFNLISYENIIPSDFKGDVDALTDGFDTMADSMGEMVDGTTDLRDGLSDMRDGIHDLDTGLSDLYGGTGDFATGMDDFYNGLGALQRGLSDLSSGSGQIGGGLNDLSGNGASLVQGYGYVYQGLQELKTGSDGLIDEGLVAYLNSLGDPALAGIAEYLTQENAALDDIIPHMNELNAGLSQYTGGVSALADQYATFNSGIAGLPRQIQAMRDGFSELRDGFTDIRTGIGDISDGVHTLYTETERLPGDVQTLIDGQTEFRDGITDAKDEAKESIDSFFPGESSGPVSFIDSRNTVNSVQYMLKTPDIVEDGDPDADLEGNGEKKGFFQRLLDLFR